MTRLILASLLWILATLTGDAQPGLFPAGEARPALLKASLGHEGAAPRGSLFVGTARPGLLAAALPRAPRGAGTVASRLRDLVARAEAGPEGYDAVQYGARIRPPRRPTRMTLAEIEAWTLATPGQPHAIGRYQFIPKTLRWLSRRAGLPPDTRFTPEVQDRLADLLLEDAGLAEVQRRELPRKTFMLNLARIWAGLPTASGKSYYDGVAGNSAVLSWDEFERGVHGILDG